MNNLAIIDPRYHFVCEHLYQAQDINKDAFRSIYLFSAMDGKIISASYNHKNLRDKRLSVNYIDALKLSAAFMISDTASRLVRVELVKFNQ